MVFVCFACSLIVDILTCLGSWTMDLSGPELLVMCLRVFHQEI